MFTIVELITARETLSKIANQPINALIAFRVGKIIKAVNDELSKFDEIRADLFKKYGTIDSDGKPTFTNENVEIINKELTPILLEEIELKFNKLNINDIKDINLTTFEILGIEKFLIED